MFSSTVNHIFLVPLFLHGGSRGRYQLQGIVANLLTFLSSKFSSERHIASFLSAIGQKFLSMYRSCGTYIAFVTILISVYLVKPNYVSFGYIFLLLFWITGRQMFEETKRRLWFPLKAYAVLVFMFIYCLSSFVSFQLWLSGFIDLYFYLGYNSEAPLLDNVWESLAVLIVMQLYSYERRQNGHYIPGQSSLVHPGVFGFLERFLVWHGQKILFAALFYASLSPISVFGFVYLLGLVICTTFPKSSSVPSKSFLIYTGFLVSAEYLFQLWGMQAQMFPGQKYAELSFYLGLRVYEPGFWGIESGLRGKVLVVAACTLQYNVFRWLERTPGLTIIKGKYEEPCPLFVSAEGTTASVSSSNGENPSSIDHASISIKQGEATSNSWPFFSPRDNQAAGFLHPKTEGSESGSSKKFSFGHFWGSIKESHKWNKRRILALKKERFETQKNLLNIYLKFWIENMFNLYGLEINMIALLVASFALLNAISLVYIALLAACVLLRRRLIQKLWPVVVFLFASILAIEYVATWNNLLPLDQDPSETSVHCHDCWSIAAVYLKFCRDCWLGVRVDDPRTLISYFVVFMLACFKLRADQISSFSESSTYHQMKSQRKNSFVWRDLSFETKSMWTVLDYLRLYCYVHLLDVVLILILITGTLEYDILHLGYLAFALVFARMRLEILKKKNKIFRFLRVYNFVLIIFSLAYQSPFVGNFNDGKCETVDYIYEVIGFYKYDYGFRITARSALVEIIIFMLVSLQSYMFSSQEFDYVSRYLEAEQIGAIVREQEKKAARKTEQLQQIREAEEKKRQRNLQVEKMKSEMLNLRVQLHRMNSDSNFGFASPRTEGLRRRRSSYLIPDSGAASPEIDGVVHRKEGQPIDEDTQYPFEAHELPMSATPEAPDSPECSFGASPCEITEIQHNTDVMSTEREIKEKSEGKDNALISAVQLIGDGVSQVQFIGNQAVNNLANFLNISPENSDINEQSSVDDEVYDEMESQNRIHKPFERSTSLQSDRSSDGASFQIGRILRHIWSRMQSNNDIVIFFLIVVDRVIYLCSFATGKVVYYLFSLILFTYAVTEYAWSIYPTQQHAAGLALRFIFLAKAMSLALQAIQIRYGLPHKSTLYRQFLTSEVSRINYYGYRLYRALPFLYELRCVLDWSCTATSLTMYDWLKLEDVNASLYLVKCDTVLNRATHKHGERQTKMTKCCNGICLFFILLCVIWAPMLMYSSGNPTNIANPIKDASVQIDIKTAGGKLTLYQTTLCERISGDNIDLGLDLGSQSFLPTYNKNDIQLICCQADASVLWLVPDTVVTRFIQSLDWDTDMDITFSWLLNRDRPKGKETVKYERSVDPQDLPKRSDVQMVLNGSMDGFRVHNLYPKFFRVTGSGDVRSFEDQTDEVSADILMNHADTKWWWSFHNLKASENISACEGMDGPVAIIMSEETPPQGFLGDTLSKFSIWGLYITFVLAVGRFIRLQCSDLRMRIPYENLPSCDRLIAICEDLYAARAEGELGVEEVLYWTLVKIYRSPHMLLEYTKLDYDA
ncbi:BnaA04g29450D [Brassica napus]|uniref:BnaA04g29450D protein n=1 Tax=Brassica napus TaxID=3708 RepID=A0A078J171_BRANA|nr:BnaA04g29450D [Brassica napus]